LLVLLHELEFTTELAGRPLPPLIPGYVTAFIYRIAQRADDTSGGNQGLK